MILTLNEQAFMEIFFRRAEKVARDVGGFTLGRAQHHAPVRKLFRGTTYKRTELFDRYQSPAGVARQAINRRMVVPGEPGMTLEGRETRERGRAIVGHPNSATPVIRHRVPGRSYTTTADFRRAQINPETGRKELAQVDVRTVRRDRSGRETEIAAGRKVSGEAFRTPSGDSVLTARGRYEVRSGRAVFQSPGNAQARVGGYLRSKIHLTEPERVGDSVWVHIVSPAPYSLFMEYGTVHNRPYPYMRPSLAESEGRLKSRARREFPSDSSNGFKLLVSGG